MFCVVEVLLLSLLLLLLLLLLLYYFLSGLGACGKQILHFKIGVNMAIAATTATSKTPNRNDDDRRYSHSNDSNGADPRTGRIGAKTKSKNTHRATYRSGEVELAFTLQVPLILRPQPRPRERRGRQHQQDAHR